MAELFTNYEVEYTNIKPWNNTNLGSGKMVVSIVNSSSSIKAKLKKLHFGKAAAAGNKLVFDKTKPKEMRIKYKRNTATLEASGTIGHGYLVAGYDNDDNLVVDGLNTLEGLGEIKYFDCGGYLKENIFFGINNFAELQIKLDLMV